VTFGDILSTAIDQIWSNKLRSFFTLLGIIVSVAFLVTVVAIITGMNSYVKENIAEAMIGKNSFTVRRTPIQVGFFDDEMWRKVVKRPRITVNDANAVRAAVPDADAIALTSGWPTPQADIVWRNNTIADVMLFGVTPDYQEVQDYKFERGVPLSDVDIDQRRAVVVVGHDIAENLFKSVDPIGQEVRIAGEKFTIVGVIAPKGRVLGQSFDSFALVPINRFEMLYGRRQTTSVAIKMKEAADVAPAMQRAEEAMRIASSAGAGK
jgi:putative ABC transport system permease protein